MHPLSLLIISESQSEQEERGVEGTITGKNNKGGALSDSVLLLFQVFVAYKEQWFQLG